MSEGDQVGTRGARQREIVGRVALIVAEAQRLLDELRALMESTPKQAEHKARTYEFRGQQMTIRELAAIAGVSYLAMHSRLKSHPPEVAVTMTGVTRLDKARKTYPYQGRECSVTELATLAGCGYYVMYDRLRRGTPEDAVAMGAKTHRRSAAPPPPPAPTAAPPVPAAPRRPPVFEVSSPKPAPAPALIPHTNKLTPGSKLDVERQPPALRQDVPVFVPADVKRTVVEPPKPAEPPRLFSDMRPGQYLEHESLAARAVRETKR